MGERVGQITKEPEVKQSNSRVRRTERLRSMDPLVNHILFLQRTAGNQAVSRLMKSGALQAKLRIGQPGDKYEQEADQVADAVMRMPEPGVQRQPEGEEGDESLQAKPLADQITSLVQRQVEPEEEEEEEETLQTKPLVNQITPLVQVQRQEEPEEEEEMIQAKPLSKEITPFVQRQVEPEEEEEETLQTKPLVDQITPLVQVQRQEEPEEEEEEEMLQAKSREDATPEVTNDLESQINAIRGGGRPMGESERAYFEPRFGADFSQVKVHTGEQAAESSRAVNAKAYTIENDIVFQEGQYAPGTSVGQRLMAHELTHVVQQTRGLSSEATGRVQEKKNRMHEDSETDTEIIQRNLKRKHPLVATRESDQINKLLLRNVSLPSHIERKTNHQQPISVSNIPEFAGNATIRRWSGYEHKAFGDLAGRMAAAHRDKFKINLGFVTSKQHGKSGTLEHGLSAGATKTPGDKKNLKSRGLTDKEGKLKVSDEVLGVSYGTKSKSMSLGTGTEISGDQRKSAASLANTENADHLSGCGMIELASSNINHFFPLAAKEWGKHHQKAKATALAARAAYKKNGKNMGDKLTKMALQLEAFGLHFLQDSYAAGHQYPRALNMITKEDKGILSASGIYGLTQAKSYHDALNKIPDGIDLEVGGKFHGDDTADSRDNRVAIETYNSLVEVLSPIAGIRPGEVGGEPPRANYGPDVNKIMQDPAARDIWFSLEHSLHEYMLWIGLPWESFLEHARNNKDGTVTTDAGSTFTVAEILDAWNNRKGANSQKFITNMLMLGIESEKTGILDHNADDNIINALTNEKGQLDVNRVPTNLTKEQVVKLCKALIDGACVGTDEDAVLFILRRQNHAVFKQAVKELKTDYIDSGLDGIQWDTFLLLCAGRYPAGANLGAYLIASEKNDDAARMLITGGEGVKKVAMSKLADEEWIGIIKALLSGKCGDDDENAIVRIVYYLVTMKKNAKLIHYAIGPSEMDKGVDGKQWDQIRSIMKKGGFKWSWWG